MRQRQRKRKVANCKMFKLELLFRYQGKRDKFTLEYNTTNKFNGQMNVCMDKYHIDRQINLTG